MSRSEPHGSALPASWSTGRVGDVPLDDSRFEEIWTVAERLRQPIFIHQQIPTTPVRNAAYRGLGDSADVALATFAWGWHLEAGTAALAPHGKRRPRQAPRPTADPRPLGRAVALLAPTREQPCQHRRSRSIPYRIPTAERVDHRLWHARPGVACPRPRRYHPDRILFSTDYPFQQPTHQEIEEFLLASPSEEARTAFASGNAKKLFAIDRNRSQARFVNVPRGRFGNLRCIWREDSRHAGQIAQ
jgi:hypothetical protein